MATRVIDDTKLQNIAVAIQSKDNGGQMTVDEMAGRIDNIIVAPVPVQNPALILWDWEGTKLAEYSREDALALTELPAPSALPMYAAVDHELLVFQKWNWSLADIKEWVQEHRNTARDVVAIYMPTDGQNHNYWGNPRLNSIELINVQKRSEPTISNYQFQYHNCLKNISCPNEVTQIGDYAFHYCLTLRFIGIPNGVTSIGNFSFAYDTSLLEISLPNTITSIGNGAFQACRSLIDFEFPKNIVFLASYLFQDCYSLTKISISNGITSIGTGAFMNCISLCDILNESHATLSNKDAFSGLPSNYRNYVPRADLSWFETATNWSTIYAQGHIVAIEDYIDYLESIGFNVDAYKEAA